MRRLILVAVLVAAPLMALDVKLASAGGWGGYSYGYGYRPTDPPTVIDPLMLTRADIVHAYMAGVDGTGAAGGSAGRMQHAVDQRDKRAAEFTRCPLASVASCRGISFDRSG